MSEFYNDDERLGKVPLYNRINIPFQHIREIQKVRKEYICEMCKSPIHVGDSCQYFIGVEVGVFYYYRLCNECK